MTASALRSLATTPGSLFTASLPIEPSFGSDAISWPVPRFRAIHRAARKKMSAFFAHRTGHFGVQIAWPGRNYE